jgi:hypothetical protein
MYFDENFDNSNLKDYEGFRIRDEIQRSWAALPSRIRQCFQGGLRYVSSNLLPSNHLEGACTQFYDLFDKHLAHLNKQYKRCATPPIHHFYLMEPDAQPIRTGWLDAIAEEFKHNLPLRRGRRRGKGRGTGARTEMESSQDMQQRQVLNENEAEGEEEKEEEEEAEIGREQEETTANAREAEGAGEGAERAIDAAENVLSDEYYCPYWWVKGSASVCDADYGRIALRHDYHINGNAMYCVESRAFSVFRQRVRDYYPPGLASETPTVSGCHTGKEFEGGYDHCFYQYRQQIENFDYAKYLHPYFQYTQILQNRCKFLYNPVELRRQFPHTYIIHSSAVFHTKSTQLVEEAFQKHLFPLFVESFENEGKRFHYQQLVLKYSTRLRVGEIQLSELIPSVCGDHGWLSEGAYATAADPPSPPLPSFRSYLSRIPSIPPVFRPPPICSDKSIEQQYTSSLALSLFSQRYPSKLYAYSVDLHTGPQLCTSEIFRELDVVLHMEVDYGMCSYHGVCRDRLQILPYDDEHHRGFSLEPCPHRVRQQFHEYYALSEEIKRADIILCSHPTANCELFMSLNKTLIIIATTRIEFGRNDEGIDWRQEWITGKGEKDGKINFSREAYNKTRAHLRWVEWLYNLKTIASSSRHVIAANNYYDQLYIQYFTGIRAEYIPSDCTPLPPTDALLQYTPIKKEFLMGPSRTNLDGGPLCKQWGCNAMEHPIMQEFIQIAEKRAEIMRKKREEETAMGNRGAGGKAEGQTGIEIEDFLDLNPYNRSVPLQLVPIRSLYSNIDMQDVLNHPAVVIFPYQVSIMFAYELYRASVPLLAPSVQLLQEWHEKYYYLYEKNYGEPERIFNFNKYKEGWDKAAGEGGREREGEEEGQEEGDGERESFLSDIPDPNDSSHSALSFWLQRSDFYQWPYITYYSSMDELHTLMMSTDFHAIHLKQKAYNQRERSRIKRKWQRIIARIHQQYPPGTSYTRYPSSINQSLRSLYGENVWQIDENEENSLFNEKSFVESRETAGGPVEEGNHCLFTLQQMWTEERGQFFKQTQRF